MSKGRDRNIFQRDDGKWVNKRQDASRASSISDTQREVMDAGREMLKRQGGGELIVHGQDGKIRSKNTVAPGNDPRSVKG